MRMRLLRRFSSASNSPANSAMAVPGAGSSVTGKVTPQTWATLLPIEVAEELDEAGEQVALGEQHVDGKADPERLDAAPAGAVGCRCAWRSRSLGVCRSRSGRLIATSAPLIGRRPSMPLEQLEEADPCGLVDFAVAVLRGIATGGVEQDSVVGEPPVAVACTAYAADGLRPEPLGERETQAGVEQGGGLAGTWRTDDDVPRQLIDIARAEVPLDAHLLQDCEGVLHPPSQLGELFGARALPLARLGRLTRSDQT